VDVGACVGVFVGGTVGVNVLVAVEVGWEESKTIVNLGG
jgi:hypothetical protein